MTAVDARPPKGRPTGWRERARVSTLKAVGPPDMYGLSSTLKRGATYSAAALLFCQVISFAQTLVLARLLTPTELGVYVAGTILSGVLISVSEGGLRGALIQRETDTATAAATVFWATGGTGVLMALIAIGTAPLVGFIANFDPEDTATVVAIAVTNSGILLIHALTNVPDGLMQRQFNFRRRLIVDPARMAMFAIVSIVFAALGYGAWAQVFGNYAAMLTWLALSWWFAGWLPGFAKPSYKLWRELARFAYPLMIEGIVEKVRHSAETAIIARGLSADPLGQYRYGQRLSLIPGTAVVQIGSYVLFPAFSRLANDPPRLRSAFLRAAQWSWIASAGVAGLIIAIGEPAVIVLLGQRWAAAGLVFVALSGYGLGIALQAAGSEAIKATGRSQLLNWTTATSIVLGIGLLLILMPPFGLIGVGLAVSITELAIGAVVLVLTHRVVPYPIPAMVRMLVPPLLVAGAAAAAIGYLEHAIVRSPTLGFVLGLLALTAESILFLVIFLGGMALVEPKLARRAVRAVAAKLRRGGGEEEAADDGIERRDPRLDPPTMLIPVFTADATMEFGRRQSRDWGSPTAATTVLPVIRPASPVRNAAADDGAERAVDAIEAGERPPVGSIVAALDGPTEQALPARPATR
ncbi:MAG: oligosaccharide flippase family protein, partial [Pseudonocardia sp.]|nr:oligosaccharide flippase family protein [Pseudonocardia sp.]